VAVVQYTFTHKQYIEQHKIWEECRPCPVFASYTLAFALQLRKNTGNAKKTAILCTAHFLWEVLMKKYVTDLTCKINIT
jgi:hypothetical protein